ncbi:hypothetical protein CERZMDRAFT_100840 [Cercospora zeae-maydis SCOH1-5]|uniref:Survival Motor Neuron Gemin2-binding domain-containing protein n=1 Tax=Cercospora zeae-maydis SCOH1-5 TaxID=717836 RepID=A0A6A6F719_9PEZI|nr:hypothetical protein CERZMDRAFT_100840 [Cercospora zeae-maydis SCOH1-5]
MANQELSHDELWDDSALVDSWNDAFEEYKKYHSLARKGEKVEIVQETDMNAQVPSKAAAYLNANGTAKPSTAAPINFAPSSKQSDQSASKQPSLDTAATTAAATTSRPAAFPALASLPQTLIGGAQNEDLKNIMMSWYYAGYYTGIYEGQQKAWAEMHESMQAQEQQQQQQQQEGE